MPRAGTRPAKRERREPRLQVVGGGETPQRCFPSTSTWYSELDSAWTRPYRASCLLNSQSRVPLIEHSRESSERESSLQETLCAESSRGRASNEGEVPSISPAGVARRDSSAKWQHRIVKDLSLVAAIESCRTSRGWFWRPKSTTLPGESSAAGKKPEKRL